jgi:hypothetical protein
LDVTPFSTSEVSRMSELLNDRNLLVHHGGIFTLNYSRERSLSVTAPGAFWNSVIFTRTTYLQWQFFLLGAARKLASVTTQGLEAFVEGNVIELDTEAVAAMEFLPLDSHPKWQESDPFNLDRQL